MERERERTNIERMEKAAWRGREWGKAWRGDEKGREKKERGRRSRRRRNETSEERTVGEKGMQN
jgi:hypothetical protein